MADTSRGDFRASVRVKQEEKNVNTTVDPFDWGEVSSRIKWRTSDCHKYIARYVNGARGGKMGNITL